MGGNHKHSEAPNLPAADRIPAEDYHTIVENLLCVCAMKHSIDTKIGVPYSVGEKQDFGDIDILCSSYAVPKMREILAEYAWVDPTTGESYLNQLTHPESQDSYICTLKAGLRTYNVQVDIISTPVESFDFAFGYFSYNDLGNLIGRIAHRRGMKFGHDGLWYIHRRGDRLLKDILITLDFREALEYLGFDADHYFSRGFETYDKMFNWVKTSKYFDPVAYPLEHRNHRARTRDRKRKTYNMFLEWLNFEGVYVKSDKEARIAQLRKDYPHVDAAIKEAEALDDLRIAYKEKINGIYVGEITKLEGKKLGELMNYVRCVLPMNAKTIKLSESTILQGVQFASHLWEEGVNIYEPSD